MSTLYIDSKDGTLSAKQLDQYLRSEKIDDTDANDGLTPLIAAINGAHLNVVKLLLDKGADANAQSRDHRTPLFWTTWKRGDHRSDIVSLLIEKGADVNETSDEVQKMTPLMNAVDKLRDPEVISLLVDAGANPNATNARGKSAKSLAEKIGSPKLSNALRPKLERNAPTAETVNMLVKLFLFIVAWINSKVLDGVAQRAAKQVFNLTGANDPDLDEQIGGGNKPPKTKEEFQDKINDWIIDSNLGKFFPPGDNYLPTVAEKALALQGDEKEWMGQPEHIEKLVKLSLYKTIIYCDDSGSMQDPTSAKDSTPRSERLKELVKRMARICTKIVPDDSGVDLFYIHKNGVKNAREDEILKVMDDRSPAGATPIGTQLKKKILDPFVYKVLESPERQFKQPILITIITDGAPTREDSSMEGYHKDGTDGRYVFETAVLNCIEALRKERFPDHAVIFQVSQIGEAEDAGEFLKELEDRSHSTKSLYCTAGQLGNAPLAENEENMERWLFKLLTSPVVGALSGAKPTTP